MIRTFVLAAAAAVLCAGAAFAQPAPAPAPADRAAPPAAPGVAQVQLIAPNPSADIIANLTASGHFTTLLKAIQGAGLTSFLQDKTHSFTLFAPTDEAFAALPAGVLDDLMKPANSAKLQQVVAYHVLTTKVTPDQIVGHAATPIPTVINKPVTLDGVGGSIKVNDANVIQAGAPASNGAIYAIDKVLMAP